jgi:hypothetical protein
LFCIFLYGEICWFMQLVNVWVLLNVCFKSSVDNFHAKKTRLALFQVLMCWSYIFFTLTEVGVTNTDPNRPGMHMKLIKFLLKLRAPRIVYVSCNPATCARDLDYLCHGVVRVILLYFSSSYWDSAIWVVECFVQAELNIKGCYKLISLQPVDMFPHTPHVECVCLLELVDLWLFKPFHLKVGHHFIFAATSVTILQFDLGCLMNFG